MKEKDESVLATVTQQMSNGVLYMYYGGLNEYSDYTDV